MMLNKNFYRYFTFFSFIFSSLANAQQSSNMGKLLHRTLAQEWGRCSNLAQRQRHFFMNTHWTKHLVKEDFGDCILDSSVTVNPRFQQIDLYRELAKRLWDGKDIYPVFKDKIHPYRKIPDQINKGDVYVDNEYSNFVPGHFHTIRKITKVPKFLISFNDDPGLDVQPKPLIGNRALTSWFIPLEQALFCRNVGEYRNIAALIRHWSAYSRHYIFYSSLCKNSKVA